MSPSTGPLQKIGQLHDQSVKTAFLSAETQTKGLLTVREERYALRLLFLSTGDPTDPTSTACVEEARRAVEDENAIAILGPVSSDCTKQVLAENLEVPVVTSLSTATDLGGESEWLFRTIAHDHRRLGSFVNSTARTHEIGVDRSIAIYKGSEDYGSGLLADLTNHIPSLDAEHIFEWSEAIIDTTHHVRVTDDFRQEMHDHHAIASVFVLGSSARMDSVLWALDDMFKTTAGDPNFVLVGSTRFANDFPVDTWLIGEATISTSRNLITRIVEKNPSDALYISTLDASVTLREAIRRVLAQPGADTLALPDLKRELRRVLDQNQFPSSERGRWVDFDNGEIENPPSFPIYRIWESRSRHFEPVNPDKGVSWVEVRLVGDPPDGHLEGPLTVELIPHGEDLVGTEVTLQVAGDGENVVPVETVELDSLGTRVSFVPSFLETRWSPASWFPTTLTITTSRTPALEHVEVEGLSWPASYLLAALSALFGVLLYNRYRTHDKSQGEKQPQEEREAGSKTTGVRSWTVWTYLERCLAGLVIAFLIIHVGPLLEGEGALSMIPIPEFGSSRWLNAILSGLMGGWLGLNPIMGLIASVIGTLTPLFQSDS